MSRVPLEITLELNVICPHCDHHNDLRERDCEGDYFWSRLAVGRLNGKMMEIKEEHECFHCLQTFNIEQYEIM